MASESAAASAVAEWLQKHSKLSSNVDDSILEYITQILTDESTEEDERVEAVVPLLSEATGGNIDHAVLRALLDYLKSFALKATANAAPNVTLWAPLANSAEAISAMLQEDAKAVTAARELRKEQERQKLLFGDTDEFSVAKKRIVDKFAIQFDDTIEFTPDGQIRSGLQDANISKDLMGTRDNSGALADCWVNDNSDRVLKAAQAERERSRLARQQEKLQIQEQKLQEKLKKEKEKKRTAKRERRTGR